MAKSTFEEAMVAERERLNAARQDALTRRSAIDAEIADIDKELGAITAYEKAKQGKAASSTNGTRSRTPGRRSDLLAYIKQNPDAKRADILKALNPSNDRSVEGSISNALTSLKKTNKITHADGRYRAS